MACEEGFRFGGGYGSFGGTWIFDESKMGFSVWRMADGIKLTINARIVTKGPMPVHVYGLQADIASRSSQGHLRLGTAFGNRDHLLQPGQEGQIYLEWYGSLAAFEALERQRGGGNPEFVLDCRANIEFVETVTLTVPDKPPAVPRKPPGTRNILVRTAPEAIQVQANLSFPKDAWVTAINSAGLRQALLLEIPLPPARPEPWAPVWQALDEARRHFDQGGTTGWNGCVTAVRKALDAWQQIDGEKTEWEATKPKRDVLEGKSKDERLKALRWQLRQCAHLAPHSADKE